MEIIIIASIGVANELGKDNGLLWKLPDEMKFFTETTLGSTVIMGRKTYESIPKNYRPLRGRINIVISSNKSFESEGITVVDNFYSALGYCEKIRCNKVFVIGGASVYKNALKMADKMYMTHVNGSFSNADTFFPKGWDRDWDSKLLMKKNIDDNHEYSFDIFEYWRK